MLLAHAVVSCMGLNKRCLCTVKVNTKSGKNTRPTRIWGSRGSWTPSNRSYGVTSIG